MNLSVLAIAFLTVSNIGEVKMAEYNEACDSDADCVANDYKDPLVCKITGTPTQPPTTSTQPTTEPPPSPSTTIEPTTTLLTTTETTTVEPTTIPPTTTEITTTETTTTPPITTETTTTEITTVEPTTTETTTVEPTTTETTTTEITTSEPTTTSPTTTEITTTETTTTPPTTNETTIVEPTTTEITTAEPTTTELSNSSESATPNSTSSNQADAGIMFNQWNSPYDNQVASLGICSCPEDMFRDLNLNRCVSPIMGKCYEVLNPETPVRTCPQFASCYTYEGNEGTCYCAEDATFVDATGECKLTYGSSRCEADNHCNNLKFLTCIDRKCMCLYQDTQKWNEKLETCGFVVGASCAKIHPIIDSFCVENAECINDICQCSRGYVETPNKDCKLPFNGTCSTNSDCNPPFRCSNNACVCPEGQVYYESTDKCHIPEGDSCNPSSDSCILGADCQDGKCKCQSGYETMNDHTCQGLHGSICSDEIPCHPNYFLSPCNSTIGTCECLENYDANPTFERCIGKLNADCRLDEDCFEHAICNENDKICKCGGNLIPGDDNKSCYAQYRNSCGDDIKCHPKLFLKCDPEHGLCSCDPEDETYDDEKGQCAALANKLCGASDTKGIGCVTNSSCLIDSDDTRVTKCFCLSGFSANETGFCVESSSASGMSSLFSATILIPFLLSNFIKT